VKLLLALIPPLKRGVFPLGFINSTKFYYVLRAWLEGMDALILAAGEGTRMRPLTANTAKPMLPVAGKPCIEHTFDALKKVGVKRMVVVIGWRMAHLRNFIQDQKGVKIETVEQKSRLGTAHAIQQARKKFSEPFLCVNGDVVLSSGMVKDLLDAHKKSGLSVVLGKEVEKPERYGVLQLDRDKTRLVKILEKPKRPPSNLINTGLYVLDTGIFKAIDTTGKSRRGEYEITDSLTTMAREPGVVVKTTKHEYIDISEPWDMLDANAMLLEEIDSSNVKKGTVEKNVFIKGNVVLGKKAVLKSGTYIEGNVIIGEGSVIGPNTYIRGPVSVGSGCKIGASVEVKNTIVMDGSHLPHHNYVGDSIIGQRCNLGAGTKIANLRLDDANITSYIRRTSVETGRRKLGVIMGDDVKTGINSMIDVGTVIGENSFIGPGALASGWIEPNSKIF
jgi:bifunctional UDP-N-acetylglucosamine pyrophosphorylase/glucosamine-1-phosphate N-acetyltransferase